MSAPPRCLICERGPEACEWCHGDRSAFEAICDCGLYDFGVHLVDDCLGRTDKRYVIAASYESAELPRDET